MAEMQGILQAIYDEANHALRMTAPGGSYVTLPSAPASGDAMVWNGSAWVADHTTYVTATTTYATAATVIASSQVTGDTNPRLQMLADGKMKWGPGNTVTDTVLYRSAAATLTTDGILVIDKDITGQFAADPGKAQLLITGTTDNHYRVALGVDTTRLVARLEAAHQGTSGMPLLINANPNSAALGGVGVGVPWNQTPAAMLDVRQPDTGSVAHIVRAIGSATADLVQFQNSSAVTKTALLPGGTLISDDAALGVILKDAQGTPHYWRVTISAGALAVADLGTTRPTS